MAHWLDTSVVIGVGAGLLASLLAIEHTRMQVLLLVVYTPVLVLLQMGWLRLLQSRSPKASSPSPSRSSSPDPVTTPITTGNSEYPISVDEATRARWIDIGAKGLDWVITMAKGGAEEGWVTESDKDGVKVAYTSKGAVAGKHVFRSQATLDCSPQELFDLLFTIKGQTDWNKSLIEYQHVEQVDKQLEVLYSQAAPVMTVSSRDFIHVRQWEQLPCGGFRISALPLPGHPKCPEKPGAVRATVQSGYLMESLDDGTRTHFTFIMDSNLKGWLLTSVVDLTLSTVLKDNNRVIRDEIKRRQA